MYDLDSFLSTLDLNTQALAIYLDRFYMNVLQHELTITMQHMYKFSYHPKKDKQTYLYVKG